MIRISCLGYSNSTDNVITSLLRPTFAQDTRQTCFAVVLLCEFALYLVLWIFLLELCSIKRVACDVCIFETANCFLRQTILSSRLESKFQFYPTTDLYLTPSPCNPTPLWVCMYQVTHTHSMHPVLTAQTPLCTHTPPPQAPYWLCPFGVGIYGLSGTSARLMPPTYIHEGIVDSCWMTWCEHFPCVCRRHK